MRYATATQGAARGRRSSRRQYPILTAVGREVLAGARGSGEAVLPAADVGVNGHAHEGPPGYGHGGVSAMLLDELMGWAHRRRSGASARGTRYAGPPSAISATS